MPYVDWRAQVRIFANCNCAYGCPCQFNALPTKGYCEAVAGFVFDEGHFGDTRLDGLNAVYVVQWPGPVHLGNGAMQVIIDQRADAAQREALLKILYGEETEPGATMWNVFMTTITTVHDPIYAEVDLDINVDKREARIVVPGSVESMGEPIRNPVTGAEQRARLVLPDGFEFTSAEFGSGTTKSSGAISMNLNASHAHLANTLFSSQGVIQ